LSSLLNDQESALVTYSMNSRNYSLNRQLLNISQYLIKALTCILRELHKSPISYSLTTHSPLCTSFTHLTISLHPRGSSSLSYHPYSTLLYAAYSVAVSASDAEYFAEICRDLAQSLQSEAGRTACEAQDEVRNSVLFEYSFFRYFLLLCFDSPPFFS
jgi:hypothetical protein